MQKYIFEHIISLCLIAEEAIYDAINCVFVESHQAGKRPLVAGSDKRQQFFAFKLFIAHYWVGLCLVAGNHIIHFLFMLCLHIANNKMTNPNITGTPTKGEIVFVPVIAPFNMSVP